MKSSSPQYLWILFSTVGHQWQPWKFRHFQYRLRERWRQNAMSTLLSIIGIICGCKTEHDSKRKSSLITLLAALLQLITAPIIVGWIWSVLWGITFVNISMTKEIETTNPNSML